MFCPECGAAIPDEARFCTRCGALTAREETPKAATTLVPNPDEEAESAEHIASAEPTPGLEEPEPAAKKKAKPKIIAAVIAAVLVICGIGGFVAYSHSQAQVYILLAAPQAEGYDEGDATPMPVEVTGVDANGNEVDEMFYVTPDHGIQMPRGEYELTFPDPIASGSSLFAPDASSVKCKVGDDGWTINIDGEEQAADTVNVAYRAAAPEDVTDEMIEQLRGWMKKAGISESEIDKFADAVTNARQERLDQIAAEEEAARVEARKAAIEATAYEYIYRTYDCSTPDLKQSNNRGSVTDLYSPNATRLNGVGWLGSSLKSIDSFQVIDENTVSFSVTYDYGVQYNHSVRTDSVTLTFDENGLILSGAWGMP